MPYAQFLFSSADFKVGRVLMPLFVWENPGKTNNGACVNQILFKKEALSHLRRNVGRGLRVSLAGKHASASENHYVP